MQIAWSSEGRAINGRMNIEIEIKRNRDGY